jgi:predicted transcriptional regulator
MAKRKPKTAKPPAPTSPQQPAGPAELTLRSLRDQLRLLALHPSNISLLQNSSPEGYVLWKHLSRADVAVCQAQDAHDPTLIGVRHYVTQRFGGCDLNALGRVVDWLVAEHGMTADEAEALPLADVLTRLRPVAQQPPATPDDGSDDPPPTPEDAAILKALLLAGETMTVDRIMKKVKLSDKTIRTRIRKLRAGGLAENPTPKKGSCLTAKGRSLAEGLPAEAGSRFLYGFDKRP